MNDADRDKVLAMGPIIQMRVAEKRTRRPVFVGWFQPPHWIDTTYFDKEALLDPSQSDFPLMMKMVAEGYYAPPEVDFSAGDYIQYTWRRIDKGEKRMTYTHNGRATHVALRDSESAKRARQTDWQEVIRRIERAHGVTLEQMQGPRRYRPIVRARWALIAALRERGWSLMRIGKFMNRDHTTILYALRREAERRISNEELARTAGVL